MPTQPFNHGCVFRSERPNTSIKDTVVPTAHSFAFSVSPTVCGSDVNKRPICGPTSQASESLWGSPMSRSYVPDKCLMEIFAWASGEFLLVQCCHDVTFLIYYLKSFAKNNCENLSGCHLMEVLKGCWSNFIFNEAIASNQNILMPEVKFSSHPPRFHLPRQLFQVPFPSKCFCVFMFLNGENSAPFFFLSS